MRLVAIDFETADYGPDSACAVGLVAIEDARIADQRSLLIRPPRRDFRFTHIHGLTWRDVKDAPDFARLWPGIEEFIGPADFLLAHNAGFDRSVLRSSLAAAGIRYDMPPFVCTVRLARSAWDIRPTRLPDVCRHLVIPLRHHEALSDARACAQIVLAAIADGFDLHAARI